MTYLFACGGSGGHIFPALAVAEELQSRSPGTCVFYACGGRDIESEIFRVVPKDAVFPVQGAPFRGAGSIFDPRFLLKLTQGFFQARALIKKLRPTLVAGFGGYVSFPVLMAARQMGVKTVLHEQNVAPGRANRVLAGLVGATALSFEQSRPSFRRSRKVRVTGNPIRASIEKSDRAGSLRFFGFSADKKTLLVLGGSQGAESVNNLFLSSLAYWDVSMKERLQVLHLCGRMDPAAAEKVCRESSVPSRAFSFFERMDLAYGAADLCLGRAGATFLAEIDNKDLPAVLIPYPFANGHQRENARVFAEGHRARVVEQSGVTPEKLAGYLKETLAEAERSNLSAPSTPEENAREALADFFEAIVRGDRVTG